jgi:DNA repair exonuclease SbcCD ATPase subunit
VQHVKEHRAPVRYSLSRNEAVSLAETLKTRGELTDEQARNYAKRHGVATKPIYNLAEKMNIPIRQGDPRGSSQKSMTKRDVFAAAEAMFKAPTKDHEDQVQPEPQVEADKIPADHLAVDANAELAKMREELVAEQERARKAIRQTKALREATREERERLEELEGEVSVLRRKNASLEEKLDRAKTIARENLKDLRASVQRERRLIEALNTSEADLAALRAAS